MPLSLIFGKKYSQGAIQQAGTNVNIVTFDTVLQEDYKFSARATYFPVEHGTIVSDHIIKNPDIVTIRGMVSDTPLNIFANFNRSISVFNSLIAIFERRQIIKLVTSIKVFDNMCITSLDVPRNIKSGQTLTFNIEFQRIIFDDDFQLRTDFGNIFAGAHDTIPREIVAENTNFPFLQYDPVMSLKDQATTANMAGIQGLDVVPKAILPNVTTGALVISGAGTL